MNSLPTVRQDDAIMPTTFEGMMAQAEILVRSGLLPVEIKTAAAAVAVMLTGRELGLGPMQSLRSIYIVKGKPSLSAQLMAALILRDGHAYKIIESTNSRCEIAFVRRGGQTYVHEFVLEDAKRAGLLGGNVWQAYPKALLWSRCMSAGARAAMPDVLAGMYTPEELADPDTVIVGDGGEVIDVVSRVVEETSPAPKSAPARPESRPVPEPERVPPAQAGPDFAALEKAHDGTQKWFNAQLTKAGLGHDEGKELLGRAVGRTLEHCYESGLMPDAALKAILHQVAIEMEAAESGREGGE